MNMLSDFGNVLLFLIGGAVFVLLGFGLSALLRPNRPNAEKLSSYECGEEAIGDARVQFNPRFYVIALIFLIFDVELAFLFPVAVVYADRELLLLTNGAWGWLALAELLIFVAVLALGLAYAWQKGHLQWVKPVVPPPGVSSVVPLPLYEQVNQRYSQPKPAPLPQ